MARSHLAPTRLAIVSLFLALLLTSCASDSTPGAVRRLVVPVDRTGSTRGPTWSAEVAAQAEAAVRQAVAQGVSRVDLLSIGSNTDQTATLASADFAAVDGNTEAKRQAARDDLIRQVSAAAGQAAARPVDTNGTDVFASLETAEQRRFIDSWMTVRRAPCRECRRGVLVR